jgi:flagellar basal-body rod modification protein FlgD
MATATGIWNHLSAMGQAVPSATAMDSSASGTDSSDSATISANDFLSLLVTELQNQDPTADTDPNEYINQLVNVNSLEQLISINRTLSTAMGSTGSTRPTGGLAGPRAAAASASDKQASAVTPSLERRAGATAAHSAADLQHRGLKHAPGNLGIPDANPAAERVAKSLGGQPRNHNLTNGQQ